MNKPQSFYSAVFDKNEHQMKAVAVSDEAVSYNYSELNSKVHLYAQQLKELLKHDNGCIVIDLPKSCDVIIWQLACNFVGLPFLTLDNKQVQRNKNIISSLKPLAIINNSTEQAKELFSIIVFDEFQKIEPECEYIVYSSGSTGTPKGIALRGQPAINVVSEQAKILNLNYQSNYLWILNPAFDASLSDIYSTLVSSGRVIIYPHEVQEIKTLFKYLNQYAITHIDLPPSMFHLFLKQYQRLIDKNLPLSLQYIVFGGESANELIAKQLSQYFTLIQAYGPTETTICASMNEVNDHWNCKDLGTPLSGFNFKIINDELHIGGDMVALYYLGDNEKLKNKFYQENNMTWYKTGDAVSLIDGKYIFKGRIDRQFKFHSQLICPEEIEICALNHGAEYAHIKFDGKITLCYSGNIDILALENSLASYMKPHFYQLIEDFELTSNLNANNKIVHKD